MAMAPTCFIIALSLFSITHVRTDETNSTLTSTQLFVNGVEAYLDNRFEDCVNDFEKALIKYRAYRKQLRDCRIKCKNDAEESKPLYPVDVDNLLFFEKALRQTLCLMVCENDSTAILENHHINMDVEKRFEELKPFEYLHLCYFQTGDHLKAASSAFTYLVAHPNDKVMQKNLDFYLSLDGVDKKDIVNFEAKDYVYLYVYGTRAFVKKQYKDTVNYMEESLSAYLQAEEECRAHCEGPFDHGWYPDFIPSVSNHFTVCLKCKQECQNKLKSLNGEVYDDLLPSHYHYLQAAYYKLGDMRAAAQATVSYLLFYPDKKEFLEDRRYFSKKPNAENDWFEPREEAVQYMHRNTYENKILEFISQEFNKIRTRPKKKLKAKIQITKTATELLGRKRFVADNLATSSECRTLMDISKLFASEGDGYEDRKSPHTKMESFEGITLSRTVFLVYFGMLKQKYLELYLNITDSVLKLVKQQFEVKDELYFAYTQLVCRTALEDSPRIRSDLSHKIHADNCNILRNGTCTKEEPAYTYRDYSAILYLNDDFDGGEFIFSSNISLSGIQSSVKPKCGRVVAFSSGNENLHGVKAVTRGRRCAVGMWFTNNKEKSDGDRSIAYEVVKNNSNFYRYLEGDTKSSKMEKNF